MFSLLPRNVRMFCCIGAVLVGIVVAATPAPAQPCSFPCQPGDVAENEPNCGQPMDTVNGGCYDPPIFSPIACGQTVCGTLVFNAQTFIFDNDTYAFSLTETTEVTFTLSSEAQAEMVLYAGGCPEVDPLEYVTTGPVCQPTTFSRCLPAGSYQLHVIPFTQSPNSAVCGTRYRLSMACVPCELAPNLTCETATLIEVPSNWFSSTDIGFPSANLPECGLQASAPGLWYRVVGTGNTMTASTCDPFTLYDSALSVYCGTCDGLFCAASNDNSDCEFGAEKAYVSWCSIPGQDYFIFVYGGFGDNAGNFLLQVTDDGAPCSGATACAPCPEPCQIGDEDEGEPNCGLSEFGQPDYTVNGGCNTEIPHFSPMECGVPICGSAAFNGAFRDEDWYEMSIDGPSIISIEVVSDFEAEVAIFAAAPRCPSVFPVTSASGGRCTPLTVTTDCLPENTYFIIVAPRFADVVPCPSKYTVKAICTPCEFCPVAGPDAACEVIEDLGCIPSECGTQDCATMIYGGGPGVDLDCRSLVLNEPARIDWTVMAQFNFILEIDELVLPGGSLEVRAAATGGPCGPVTTTACVGPGVFLLAIQNESGLPFPGGLAYSSLVTCGPCTAPESCGPDATAEAELDCGLPIDTTNGGCGTFPPVFSSISCGEEVCGTAALDFGNGRDTDWFEYVAEEEQSVTLTVDASFPVEIGIVDTGGVPLCPTFFTRPMTATLSTTPVSVTKCLPIGTWWFFIAPLGGEIACGAPYSAMLSCGCECKGDADRNGTLDGRDVAVFTSCLVGGFSACEQCPCADLNFDGVLDQSDVALFAARLVSGSCS